MAVHATITTELAVAAGRIAQIHGGTDCIVIDYADRDPENVWTVIADSAQEGGTHVYKVDETGYISPPLPDDPQA